MMIKACWVTLLALVLVSAGAEASRDSIRQQLLLREDLSSVSQSKDTLAPTTPTRAPTTPTRLPTAAVNQQTTTTTNAPTPLQTSTNSSSVNITISWASFDELPRWGQIVLCVLVIIFGLINAYAGYRFFRFSIFVVAGFIVFLVMVGVLEAGVSNDNPNKAAIVWGVAAACWVVAGLILVACIPVGIFLMGAAVGVVIAMVLNPIALKYVWPENPQGNLYLWMVIFGIITGLITICFERPILIVSTALTGSMLVILGIGGIAGNLVLSVPTGSNVAWETWAYIGGFLALAATGLLAQICYTAVDRDHKEKGNNGYYTPLAG